MSEQEKRSSDEIRRDIRRTQHDISRTVDDIRWKLSPQRMKNEALDTMKEAPMRAKDGLMNKIRENPLGAAMVGVGLYLMFRENDRTQLAPGYGIEYDSDFDRFSEFDAAGRRYDEFYNIDQDLDVDYGEHGGLRERASHAASAAKEKVGDVAENVREKTAHVGDRARTMGTRARLRAESLSRTSRNRARQMNREAKDLIEENPLLLGAVGAVVGALLGMAIPESDRERELMGDTRDQLKERAVGVAEEGMHRARRVFDAAKDAATEAARDEAKGQVRSI